MIVWCLIVSICSTYYAGQDEGQRCSALLQPPRVRAHASCCNCRAVA